MMREESTSQNAHVVIFAIDYTCKKSKVAIYNRLYMTDNILKPLCDIHITPLAYDQVVWSDRPICVSVSVIYYVHTMCLIYEK